MGLDLYKERAKRSSGFDAASPSTYPITAGDLKIAELGKELPLHVLEPVKDITSELVLLVAAFYEGVRGQKSQEEVAGEILDFFAAYPSLPTTAVDILNSMGTRLLGEEGMAAFMSLRPSLQDVLALLRGLGEWYGLSAGESSGSPELSTEPGTTSTTTSVPTLESTPEDSSQTPPTETSSESAA